MGRSVSTPNGAIAVAYAYIGDSDDFDWDFAREDFESVLVEKYKSLDKCDKWLGREDHAILENKFSYIGVSEYCGLVAVWITPKTGDYDAYGHNAGKEALAKRWSLQVDLAGVVGCFGDALRSIGRASNGEQFFEPVSGQQKGALGLGVTSKEGWL